MTIGREPDADLFLDDGHVSRAHAALESLGTSVLISDLGSSGGTTVNGEPVHGRRALRHGDMLRFATVEARYEAGAGVTDQTLVGSAATGGHPYAGRPTPPPDSVRFDIGQQQAGRFNNVGGNQYNQYVQQIREERSSFLEEIAGARSRARRLALIGFLLAVLGGGVYGWMVIRSAGSVFDLISSSNENPSADFSPDLPRLLGPSVGGVPVGLIGFAVASLGMLLMLVGLVLHVSTAARRRRRESEFSAALRSLPQYQPQQLWEP
jgi:hypothetical protein